MSTMEVLLRFMLLLLAITTALVTADGSTRHYLGCLHESQCQKVFKGAYCCPTGTCCHFFVRDSSKVMSLCKRIRPAQTTYCQDRDKVILNGRDLQDSRFLDKFPPNKGVVCLGRPDDSIFCYGGTDSEEQEFKARGIQMTDFDASVVWEDTKYDLFASDVVRKNKLNNFINFAVRKANTEGWSNEGKGMKS